jgi:hypothetical protein
VIFVDANVFMYAVGRPHPLKEPARQFFLTDHPIPLVTSSEVLQELLHAYLPIGRLDAFDAALALAEARTETIWSTEPADVRAARDLSARHPQLAARDLLHVACCVHRNITQIHTYDRALAAAFATA